MPAGETPSATGGLALAAPVPNPELDRFLLREGYGPAARLYHPVIHCWCGGSLAAPSGLPPEFDPYLQCTACRCLVLKFVLTPEGLEELYGIRYFREHQRAIGLPGLESRWDSDALDRIPFWLQTIARYSRTGSLLEIGSSHGRFLREASRAGYRAVGLELDAGVVAWARERNGGLDIRQARIETLADRDFDIVFVADVLEHVYDPRSFITACARVLRPGGHALFHTVVFDEPRECSLWLPRPLYHTVLYSRQSLTTLRSGPFRCLEILPGLFGCQFVVVQKL